MQLAHHQHPLAALLETVQYGFVMVPSTPIRGRPRSEASRQAILAATFAALVARGYEAMSIDSVANAAGVSKATVYRWWSSKADVAVESFFEATQEDLRMPDTGSAREDFRLQILELAKLLRGGTGRALAGMLGGARNDEDLARALKDRWLAPRRIWGAERMGRAIADGETLTGVTVGPALSLLYGPLYTPLLFGEEVPTVETMSAILALALASIFR